jgi:2-desacetyl-2-hydroxyethyl bacteriochlorophyllide A dehydrogenase
MKALRYYGPRDIRYESADDPAVEHDTDAIIKVERCSICGSDLHLYHGQSYRGDATGFCVGHEAIGEVVEKGRGVTGLKVGDKVLLPGSVGCGVCKACRSGDVVACTSGGEYCYGLSAALQGSQAEAVRVPVADFNALPIPDGITPDQALLLTDSLPTAWLACRNADVAPGKTVAVVGLGPIGLMAVEAALVLGAERVFAIDPVRERREIATGIGAIAIDPDAAVDFITEATQGGMVDSVIEAVGIDATIMLALRIAAKRGTVSVIGVNMERRMSFPIGRFFANSLTFRSGICSVPQQLGDIVPLVQAGRLRPERMISHVMPLSDGANAYDMFDKRLDGALKMVLTV